MSKCSREERKKRQISRNTNFTSIHSEISRAMHCQDPHVMLHEIFLFPHLFSEYVGMAGTPQGHSKARSLRGDSRPPVVGMHW